MHKGYLSAKVRHLLGKDPKSGRPFYTEWETVADNVPNLLTNAGKDLLHNYGYIDVAANAITAVGGNFIALTEATFTPAVGGNFVSEIATGGLSRAAATTLTHTPGANTSVISKTFTASGSFTSVLGSALFTAVSGGTEMHEANFSTGSGTLISGDQLAVTWTITLS